MTSHPKESTLDDDLKATKWPFMLFILYMISFFVRIPSRIEPLGLLRMDLLLVASIFLLILTAKTQRQEKLKIATYLKVMLIYAILVLPLVTWPGSVLNRGLPNFIKAIIFFFFTYSLVLDERRLKITVYVFLLCNTFRVLEPLYLNLTQGYWGSSTWFGSGGVDRLAGSPADIINPNGLAFVIATILPFFHYLFGTATFKRKLVYWGLLPFLLYAMALTLSRSGILAIVIIYGVIFLKSRKKFLLTFLGTIALIIFVSTLNDVQKDRYLSIVSSDTESSSSAEGRIEGLERDFEVAMIKPIFGHGLGTSSEANWNFAGHNQVSHNLWLETLQELGVVGLILFILYAKEIYKGFMITNRTIRRSSRASPFLQQCLPAMQAWLAMNFLFSFASYGLASYEWYLFGGFSAALLRIAHQHERDFDAKKAKEPARSADFASKYHHSSVT